MTQTLLVISAGNRGNGLTSVSLGLVRALQRFGLRVAFCKPVAQPSSDPNSPDRSIALARVTTGHDAPEPIPRALAESMLADGEEQVLLELIVEHCHGVVDERTEVLVVEGLVPVDDAIYGASLNTEMAHALDARVVLVGVPGDRSPEETAQALSLAIQSYDLDDDDILGAVLNRVRSSCDDEVGLPVVQTMSDVGRAVVAPETAGAYRRALRDEGIACLGLIPYCPLMALPRVREMAEALNAEVIFEGDLNRRIHHVVVAAMTLPNVLERGLKSGALVISPGDRVDTLLAAAMTEASGIKLAGLVLSGGVMPPHQAMDLCRSAFDHGLPVLRVSTNSFQTAQAALNVNVEVPADDRQRAELVVNTMANGLDLTSLREELATDREPHISPPAFRHMLIQRARAAAQTIVLPEGDEPRTITAAAICTRRGIAHCILLGDPKKVRSVARSEGIDLAGIDVWDPADHIERYVAPLCELRKHKGLHPQGAAMLLQDNVYLGTMMLKMGDVGGLVSGAVHTTANTIRPALQVIKTAPGYSLVSSIFFMCLPEQVLVYGDCAVNPDPNPAQLADIALQSAASAEAFGLPIRVAMISYSTGASGQGSDVAKVAEATAIAQKLQPNLAIDGPLQYDAASVESVGRNKAPDSKVAGHATVFIFPDLNTGNTTYKAVQRSANVISIGPMLQGLDMPVNDLSRGALVEDIVFTIALTAIQAEQVAKRHASA